MNPYSNRLGAGLIGVHAYDTTTGIFSVLPTEVLELKEGFYAVDVAKNIFDNRVELSISPASIKTYEEMEYLLGDFLGHKLKGNGIAGLMTTPMWGFKKY